MTKARLQVENTARGIYCYWLFDEDTHVGRATRYYHPDCEIYVVGRDSDRVGNAIMLALQDAGISVAHLRREKSRR